MSSLRSQPFISASEWGQAIAFAIVMESALLVLLASSDNDARIVAADAAPKEEMPIAVKPILDELPLLKLGSKVRPKLPDMWKKQAPVKRFEEASAPSEKAADTTEAIPTSKLAEKDAEAPPPDAELVKEIDQEFTDADVPDTEPALEEEGAADGVKEGTEVDPLKARWISQYKQKVLGWFNARFRVPDGAIPCEELRGLNASATVSWTGAQQLTSYTIVSPSGNATFDGRVEAALSGAIGQQLPPPPPLLKDPIENPIRVRYSGRNQSCE